MGFILILVAIAMFVELNLDIDFNKERIKGVKFRAKSLFAIIPLALAIALSCVVFVPSNTVGIRYSAINGTSENTLPEGIAFKTPLDKVYFIETTVQERTVKDLTVQTKDSQYVTMVVNVKFRVNETNAFKVYKGYKTLDALKKNIIGNYAQKSIESVVVQYNVIEALGEKKTEIYAKAEKELGAMLEKEGVQLVEVIIKDMDAGTEIEKAIKDEAVAKKAVETAEQKRLKAEKDAETKLINAKAEADANEILTKHLTKEVLLDKLLEKWDGKLPLVATGDGGMMVDMSSLLSELKE